MLHLSTVEEMKDIDPLALETKYLEMETLFESAVALLDHLIELISVRNLRHRPEAFFALFRQWISVSTEGCNCILGKTCLWQTVSDSISGAENCTVTRRSPAHWPVMS